MADEPTPDLTEVTIRDEFGNERVVTKHALPYFPGWVRVDTKGRAVSPSTSAAKEN